MFLHSLLVWLQVTICIQTILQDFFPRSYAVIWFDLQLFLHYCLLPAGMQGGKSKLALILSALILAVLFNMCFVYGCWYFNAKSVLEVIVFIIGLIVLRRDTDEFGWSYYE